MTSELTKFAHLRIPLEQIVEATNNFHLDNFISRGDFGSAYKGQLFHSGKLIKIIARRIERNNRIVEFWTEISALSDLKHTNIVSIIGYCDEKGVKIIVTPSESNGSLVSYLNSPNLTWTQRLRISVGLARALSYLHHDKGRDYGLIHRNINSYTVLLDENWEAKLSCFEISIKQSVNQTDNVFLSNPIGTIGYTDPTMETTGCVSFKSDVYSLGVMLFEILCGREAFIEEEEANSFLAPLAKYHYENKTLQDIIHPDIWNQILSPESHKKYSKTAYSCLKEVPSDRPYMDSIVHELEKALELQLRYEDIGNNLKHLKIPLSDLNLATDNFSEANRVKSRSYCTFYKTKLNYSDEVNASSRKPPMRQITGVIKRILSGSVFGNGTYKEEYFFREIEVLTSVKHNGIVTLHGYCGEGSEMILVIEDFSNGYLSHFLTDINKKRILTWGKRLKICIDVAHALNYLHYEMEDQKVIINCDISSDEIGLNENFGAKIVHFGLSRFLPPNQRDEALYSKSTVVGRQCCTDPIYKMTGKLKRESDVYSFGIVLFEILFGRLADDPIYLNGVVSVVRRSFRMGTINEMIDPIIMEENSENTYRRPNIDSLKTFVNIASKCVAESQNQRPTMKAVVEELQKALFFQENGVQYPDTEKVDNALEFTHENNISEERVECPNTDQGVDTLEKAFELRLMREISGNNMEHLKIPLNDILLATDNFSDIFSEACMLRGNKCYSFYKADFNNFDKEHASSSKSPRRHIIRVIKRIIPGNDFYREEHFIKEIHMLTSVKHPCIVTLHGFCFEGSEMILVYDDFSYGFLGSHLDTFELKCNLTWEKRLRICIDVAHALCYLHYEMEDQKVIINCGIQTNNIVLDDNLRAKIVDFEISQILPPNQYDEALITKCFGIQFYTDPEYEMTSKLKRESDVYSFGVVLFELLCGRRARDQIYALDGLTSVVRRSYNTRTLDDMIDPIIKEETSENNFILKRGANKDSLHTFIEIAYNCIAETQDQRPTMKAVVKELEKSFQENYKNNPRIPLGDIKQATHNFLDKNCIGGGGFGRVFIGTIQDGDKFKSIVAKRLDRRLGQGDQQFLSELQILLEYKHENVIGLVGYCDEKDEKIIIYEYASLGSLDKYLNDASVTWIKRLNICIDVASALYFLHGGFGKQAKVIHRDIKTPNILLNHDWKAKLADFGLSLISPLIQEKDYVINHACGTTGYLDPLYGKTGFLTIESDIYSFGVVLFEILCGISTFDIKKQKGYYLSDYMKKIFEEEKIDEAVFEKIREQMEPKSLTTFQKIAYQCLHAEREKRPTTKEVLTQLKKALKFQDMASRMKEFARLRIPLEDVVKATNNFHDDNRIPHGRSGTAYRGRLLQSGKEVKITARRFDCKDGEGDLEFLAELTALSDLKHRNVVSIIGFCDEGDEKIIVTMHAAIGRLWSQLNHQDLTWQRRLRMCERVACALSYLRHEEGRDYAILHCNINSHTILLDDNWEPKLSGFEYSIKQFGYCKDQVCFSEHSDRKRRMDPAIEKTGGVTHKSDIYLFGVLLYEMLLGRRTRYKVDMHALAIYHFENPETLQDIIDPYLWNQMSPSSLVKYSRLAYSCLNEDRAQRPCMVDIDRELGKAVYLQSMHEYLGEKWGDLKFRLSDIKSATNNFSETYKIGSRHDFATCFFYRAKLDLSDIGNPSSMKGDSTVVIKRFPYGDKVLRDEMFFKEICMLKSLKHRNIVTLRGYCVEGSERILVTEDISNGYLFDYLVKDNMSCILTWEKRLKICIDVAHAINYLHYEMDDQMVIINRSISSSNIGLDKNLRAKIVDFCLSTSLSPNQEDRGHYEHLTRLGLLFNTDPEYHQTGKLKRESDVYSFGVVMFEILCGRLAEDPIYKNESEKGLAEVARRRFCTRTLDDLIDPIIKEETNKDSLHKFIEIAYQCVALTQDQRPTMTVVLKKLEEALSYQVAPKPKVNDQSTSSITETSSAHFDQPNLDTDERVEMFESQKKEVEDYVHSNRAPATTIFMSWTSQQREYFVALCQRLQINPNDMDDEEEVA